MRYVIIGNSAAGTFAAEAIRNLDPIGSVDLISDEKYPAYARCLTSYYLNGQLTEENMFLRTEDFYINNNFNLHLDQKVFKLSPENRQVHTEAGEIYQYDKLLIATGARPSMPDIPGVSSKGVFGLRNLEDAKGILTLAHSGKKAVIVGGGFVSMKAAYALLKAGLSVTCIITSGQLLSQMLDAEAAAMIAETLTANGMEIKYHTDIQEIIIGVDGVAKGVRLTNDDELTADLIIIGKGIIPNIKFLEGSGIKTDVGILVDENMQTNISDIYAAGDVAQTYDILSGQAKINAIWPNATEQGSIAGRNMAGYKTSYGGSIGMNSADFFGLSTIAAGLAKAEGPGYEVFKLNPGKKDYLRLVYRDNKLVGYIRVGDTTKTGILTSLIKEQTPLNQIKKDLSLGNIHQKALW